MIGNKGQTVRSDNKDDYEAVVLDFLDKEMAAAQTTQETKQQSDELDALVSDLMKQVITESDQQQTGDKTGPDEFKNLLTELQPLQESFSHPADQIAPPESKTAPVHPGPKPAQAEIFQAVDHAFEKKAEKNVIAFEQPAESKLDAKVSPAPGSLFASPAVRKNRIPLIAASLACLILGIGLPIYFFSGSSKSPSKSTAPQPVAQAPAGSTVPNPVAQSPAPSTVKPATKVAPPVTTSKPAAANPSKTPVVAPQKNASNLGKHSPVEPISAPAPAPPKEEKQAAVQAAPIQAPPAPVAVAEKADVTVNSDTSAPPSLVVDKNPAPRIAANVTSNESLNLDMQPSATVHAMPKTMIAATLITQVNPKYPELAYRTHTEGAVVIDLEIDNKGTVIKATPVSGPELLRKEAVSAVMKWHYRPASVGGTSVPSQSRVTINFKLPR